MMDQRTHDPALLWAANKANLPYDRFVKGLTPKTIARIRIAYMRRNGTAIPMPAVKAAPLAVEAVQTDAKLPVVEDDQDNVGNAHPNPDMKQEAEDAETTLRAAFQANIHTLPLMVSAWKYKRFLEALNVSTNAEKNLLEKIVREEIRNVNEPTAIKLNHLLWWLEGQ